MAPPPEDKHSDVHLSWDGGKTWHASASLNRADSSDGLLATMFTNDRGFVLQDSYHARQIWFTYNQGHTWAPVTVR